MCKLPAPCDMETESATNTQHRCYGQTTSSLKSKLLLILGDVAHILATSPAKGWALTVSVTLRWDLRGSILNVRKMQGWESLSEDIIHKRSSAISSPLRFYYLQMLSVIYKSEDWFHPWLPTFQAYSSLKCSVSPLLSPKIYSYYSVWDKQACRLLFGKSVSWPHGLVLFFVYVQLLVALLNNKWEGGVYLGLNTSNIYYGDS